MRITSANDVISIATARGLSVHLKPGPPEMPVLRVSGNAKRDDATDALMGALRAFRVEIIEQLKQAEAERLKQAADEARDS